MIMDKLKGILTALVTPFDNDGKVDTKALKLHVKDLLVQGVQGFYVCGSTGEAFLLSIPERKEILEAVMEANEGKGSVICHCGAISTDFSIELGKHAASLGVDAISSVPPIYYNFSPAEIEQYYFDIADACKSPLIIYNIPAMSGVTISPAAVASMRKHPGIIGIKFTSNDFYSMEQIKTKDPDMIVYNGYDQMALAGLSMGADGAIGSTYNILAKYFIRINNLVLQNNLVEAREVQRRANKIMSLSIGTGKHLSCLKYIIGLKGIPYGACRKPFAVLTEDDKAVCKRVLELLKEDGVA